MALSDHHGYIGPITDGKIFWSKIFSYRRSPYKGHCGIFNPHVPKIVDLRIKGVNQNLACALLLNQQWVGRMADNYLINLCDGPIWSPWIHMPKWRNFWIRNFSPIGIRTRVIVGFSILIQNSCQWDFCAIPHPPWAPSHQWHSHHCTELITSAGIYNRLVGAGPRNGGAHLLPSS